jgi:hypothetical protein
VSRWHRSTYLVARLLFDATALEEAATNARALARARGGASAARSP